MAGILRFWLALTLAAAVSHAHAEGDCDLDPTIVAAVEIIQDSQSQYSVSGTFLQESASGRAFVKVDREASSEKGVIQYVNSDAANSVQPLWPATGEKLSACDLNRHYAITLFDGAKVAGRDTRVVQLRPRDSLRLGYSLSLDSNSGVLLRSDAMNEGGELLERHEFAAVEVRPVDRDIAATPQVPAAPRVINISGLPAGYRASLAQGFEERALFVSDGIAAATVIFEKLPADIDPGEGAIRSGATLTYTRGSVVAGARVLVTVIGEIPLPAARLIAEAVRLTPRQ